MKIAVIGSRSFSDFKLLEKVLSTHNITEIISGGARGADSLAEQYAKEHNIKTTVFLPDWNKYGKSAGFRRNSDIIEACDEVIAFWDGVSRGTLDSIMKASKLKKRLHVYKFSS